MNIAMMERGTLTAERRDKVALVTGPTSGFDQTQGIPHEQVIRDVLLAQQPNKRFATTDELGALAVFLSTDAAASITGAGIPVDGGWTAH